MRYWSNYRLYQARGGRVDLEEDIRGIVSGKSGYGDISRFYFFCVAFDQLVKEGIRADIAELGAYKGETASVLAKIARKMGTTAWILDTFEGFQTDDLQGIDAGQKMAFADTSLEAVRTRVGDANVRFIKGHFPESASEFPSDVRFALVHIDCDLYLPIHHALNYFYPRLVPGGYLIIHDYGLFAWDGAEKAVDEFFADKPEAVLPLTDGCTSAVVRKVRCKNDEPTWLLRKRCALLSDEWASAARGGLTEILGLGWSRPEDWGIWGVGHSHEINLVTASQPEGDVLVELDTAAALTNGRPDQCIDVFADECHVETFSFSSALYRGGRKVVIPRSAFRQSASGGWGVLLEFRPNHVTSIAELDPTRSDKRKLGLALYRLRRSA